MTDIKERRRFEAEFARVDASTDPFVSAVRATRMPMLITDPHQPDNPIVFVNAAFSKLTGYDHDEIMGENCRFLQGPLTDRNDVSRVREAIERREAIELELLNYKKDGTTFWNRVLISPVFDKDGELTYFFASQFDVTLEREKLARIEADRDVLEQEVERRTRDLTRSEERLRFILMAARMGSWTLDLATMELTTSDTCKGNFGRAPDEALTYEDLLETVLPQDRERMQGAVKASIEAGADYDIEYRIRLPKGDVRWILARGQCFLGEDGQPQTMAGITLDVTDRKLAEEHRALLAEELKHRVKNSMATMQSIAHQTLRNAASLDDAHTTLDARLQSLSTAHDVLTRESWTGAPLAEIADEALRPFLSGAAGRFTVEGPDVWLPPRMTLAFTLALHELATNASKYGALSNDRGRVLLQWQIADVEGTSELSLRWEEIDGPPVVAPARAGFGSRLIERALAAEMEGTAKIAFEPTGLVFSLRAPAPASLSARSEENRATP